MADTTLPRTMSRSWNLDPATWNQRPVAANDWRVVGRVEVERVNNGMWAMGASIIADVDPGTTGEIRLRNSATGATSDAVEITGFSGPTLLGWPFIGWGTGTTQFIFVEARRTGGTGGVRVIRAAVSLLTDPPTEWGGVATPDTVTFRAGTALATAGAPQHVLSALGYTPGAAPTLGDVGTHDFHTLVSSPITMCGEEDSVAPTINTGDLVVFAGQGDQVPSFASGWTEHLNTSHDGSRIFVVSTIASATTSYEITFTGTDAIDGQLYVFPGGGSVSAFASKTSDVDGFAGSSTFPTVNVIDNQSMVLLGSIGSGAEIGSVGSPLSVSGFTATAQNQFGYFIGAWTKSANAGSESGHTVTYPGAEFRTEYALVVRPQTATITRAQLDAILDDWVTGTGGTTHNVTSLATWTTAIGNAVPGDLVRVTAGFDGLIDVRGNRYGISGANLTSSPAGGTAGNPIIVTCADGVYVDDNNVSSNAGVLDLTNCEHVWAVGFNVRDGQFGIRCQNWGGTAANPAYVAYCDIDNIGDAALVSEGWFQAITSSGGTPPAGAGNEWGFSQYGVFESNTITDPGRRVGGNPGEGIYLGHGGSPGWIAYVKDFWVRGNNVTGWTSDGIDLKPGCHRVYITDNEFHTGHAVNGAPMSLLYVASTIDNRPAAFDFDPEIWVEGNRVYDSNITSPDGSSVNIMGYIGLSGIRIANNVLWAHPQSGTHATWRARIEKGTNDTEALAEFRNDPTWVVNNTCWGDDSFENGGYGSPLVGPLPGTVTFDLRNNIVDQASPATGEVDAAASDFAAAVPAIGAAGTAEWLTYGPGSAFDLDAVSPLVGSGVSISDLVLFIDADIAGRPIPTSSPNPGAFQPAP